MGNGIANDDYVTIANINSVANLFIGNQNISDLTGIEDFNPIDNPLLSLHRVIYFFMCKFVNNY